MIKYEDETLRLAAQQEVRGKITWRSPSNLALIKYWGKYGRQLPQNPSISFTLDTAATTTSVIYYNKEKPSEQVDLTFKFAGQQNDLFEKKLLKFLNGILDLFPFLKDLSLTIDSDNSFPHSAGIASSASAMSALALCLCSMERDIFGKLEDETDFYRKVSYVARLGSGSACRSVYSTMAVWGENDTIKEASNLYAIPYENYLHPVFKNFHDDILIVSKKEKSVSSTAGHQLMVDNIYADNRYQQARQRFTDLNAALQSGDLEKFGVITENEALTLHAMMMASEPSYILMEPNSLAQIQRLRDFRKSSALPIYFSLDAGPNLHLLYPDAIAKEAKAFIKNELLPLCENGHYIKDQVGKGPESFA